MKTVKTTRHFVGEVRRDSDRTSMCAIVNGRFGGGEGDVWVTQDVIYDFATKDRYEFYRGICRGVYPSSKAIRFEIVNGPTWGRRAQGSCCEINASDLRHLRVANVHGPKLIEESQCALSQARADAAFADISIKELIAAYKNQHDAEIAELLGQEQFLHVKELLESYIELCRTYTPKGVNGYRTPSSSEAVARKRVIELLKKGAA